MYFINKKPTKLSPKHLLLILLGFGLISCDGLEEKPVMNESLEPEFTVITERIDVYKSPEEFEIDNQKMLKKLAYEKENVRLKKIEEAKNLKLQELIKRCEEFGFKGNNNIASCVQREVQVDIALAKQNKKIESLEEKINSLTISQDQKYANSTPILDILSIIADEAQRKQNFEQQIRINKLEAQMKGIRASQNIRNAECIHREC